MHNFTPLTFSSVYAPILSQTKLYFHAFVRKAMIFYLDKGLISKPLFFSSAGNHGKRMKAKNANKRTKPL